VSLTGKLFDNGREERANVLVKAARRIHGSSGTRKAVQTPRGGGTVRLRRFGHGAGAGDARNYLPTWLWFIGTRDYGLGARG